MLVRTLNENSLGFTVLIGLQLNLVTAGFTSKSGREKEPLTLTLLVLVVSTEQPSVSLHWEKLGVTLTSEARLNETPPMSEDE